MKKFLYHILFLLLFISCKEDEKKIKVPSHEKAISRIESSSKTYKKTESDSVSSPLNEPTNNNLDNKDRRSTNSAKSISELWSTYKSTKELAAKFISENNLDSIIVYLSIAADAASDLSREDIATWQLNNIGHYSINEFKERTDFDIRLRQSVALTNSNAKALHLEETKLLFSEHYIILSNAKIYLDKAQILDSKFNRSERTDIIKRNIQFIDWVDNFISAGSRRK